VQKLEEVILGCDLGKTNDYTAICGIERWQDYKSWPYEKYELGEAQYRLVYLERFPLGTDYIEQAQFTKVIFDDAIDRYSDKRVRPQLVVDATGPGLPMLDLFRKMIPRAIGVYITGGNDFNKDGNIYYVPKKHLATNLQVIMQGKRLAFGRNIPELKNLKEELMNFQYKINDTTGHVTFEHWRESQKDDMVLSIAIALWYSEKAHYRITQGQMDALKALRDSI